jgi:phage gpG-like protein
LKKVVWNNRVLENLNAELGEKLGITADLIKENVKIECPVDTGKLQKSIESNTNVDELKATISTNVEYAPYVEFGHLIKSQYEEGRLAKKKGRKANVAPNPFMRKGFSNSLYSIVDVFKDLKL